MRIGFEKFGAGDRIRTGDIDLGKVALYQLSYSRVRGGKDLERQIHCRARWRESQIEYRIGDPTSKQAKQPNDALDQDLAEEFHRELCAYLAQQAGHDRNTQTVMA